MEQLKLEQKQPKRSKVPRLVLPMLAVLGICSIVIGLSVHFLTKQSDHQVESDRQKACEILFAVDDALWEKRGKNMTRVVEMAQFMVDRLNKVYTAQVFTAPYQDLYFRLAKVRVGSNFI